MAITLPNTGIVIPDSGNRSWYDEFVALMQVLDEHEGILAGGVGGGYYAPVTNGDPVGPEILFDASGDVIVAWVTL